jgi:S1-C subfamily serine protease
MSNPAPDAPLRQFSDALASAVAQAAKFVVAVHAPRSRSSGFFWRPGLIVTADEALAEDGDFSVTLPGGETLAATLVGRDPSTDVALLRVERADVAPPIFASAAVSLGSLALAVGADGAASIAALGVVSVAGPAWRSLRGGEIDARVELDLSLRRSAEGGLAVDASGGAFGMVVFGPRRRILVIPAATIERVAGKLATHGRVPRGFLGLGLRTVKLDGDSGTGVFVMNVEAKGPGAAAGVRQGDIIVKWDGRPVRDVRAAVQALGSDSVGRMVKLSLLRAGEAMEVALTIGERPET